MFRNTQPNSDLFQRSKGGRVKVFSLLNTCISFWKLFRNPQICRAELLDLVFDTAVVLKWVNLRKNTYNNRVMMHRAVGIGVTWIRAEASLAQLGFENMYQRVAGVLLEREVCYSTWWVWGVSVSCKTDILMQIAMQRGQ